MDTSSSRLQTMQVDPIAYFEKGLEIDASTMIEAEWKWQLDKVVEIYGPYFDHMSSFDPFKGRNPLEGYDWGRDINYVKGQHSNPGCIIVADSCANRLIPLCSTSFEEAVGPLPEQWVNGFWKDEYLLISVKGLWVQLIRTLVRIPPRESHGIFDAKTYRLEYQEANPLEMIKRDWRLGIRLIRAFRNLSIGKQLQMRRHLQDLKDADKLHWEHFSRISHNRQF